MSYHPTKQNLSHYTQSESRSWENTVSLSFFTGSVVPCTWHVPQSYKELGSASCLSSCSSRTAADMCLGSLKSPGGTYTIISRHMRAPAAPYRVLLLIYKGLHPPWPPRSSRSYLSGAKSYHICSPTISSMQTPNDCAPCVPRLAPFKLLNTVGVTLPPI